MIRPVASKEKFKKHTVVFTTRKEGKLWNSNVIKKTKTD